jgi:hypothetical protein
MPSLWLVDYTRAAYSIKLAEGGIRASMGLSRRLVCAILFIGPLIRFAPSINAQHRDDGLASECRTAKTAGIGSISSDTPRSLSHTALGGYLLMSHRRLQQVQAVQSVTRGGKHGGSGAAVQAVQSIEEEAPVHIPVHIPAPAPKPAPPVFIPVPSPVDRLVPIPIQVPVPVPAPAPPAALPPESLPPSFPAPPEARPPQGHSFQGASAPVNIFLIPREEGPRLREHQGQYPAQPVDDKGNRQFFMNPLQPFGLWG